MMRSQATIVVFCAGLLAAGPWVDAAPLGTGFTYQGQLKQNGSPCNGTYDLQFTLFDSATGGAVVGAAQTVSGVTVTGGQFTVVLNAAGQFGASAFDGSDRWLQIDVRPVGGGSFTALSPRQELTAAPYALAAAPNAITSAMLANDPASLLKISAGELSCTTNPGYVGVNGAPQLWPWELGVRGPGDPWCGMYLKSDTPTGRPVYSYLANGAEVDHWMDGPTGSWHLAVGGTERLTVLANGNVGIQTTAPQCALDAKSGTMWANHVAIGNWSDATYPGMEISYADAGAGWTIFHASRWGANWAWEHDQTGSTTVPQMQLHTDNSLSLFNSATTVGNETIRLHPHGNSWFTGGNVGIGTNNPWAALHVALPTGGGQFYVTSNPYDNSVYLEAANSAGTGSAAAMYLTGDGASSLPYLALWSDTVATNGNVGIGTTTPDRPLVIQAGTYPGWPEWIGLRTSSGSPAWHINNQLGGFNIAETNVDDFRIFIAQGGNVGIGVPYPQAKLDVAGTTRTHVLQITGGADLAEQFKITAAESGGKEGTLAEIEPGMVVCINPENPGDLMVAGKAYDRRVAGVISGAGGVKPGMLMGQSGTKASGDNPVALTGRVYCHADASYGPIEPGDLLTTSDTPGHAMKVTDRAKAQGAVLGKAMTPLHKGQGLVLVLVSLQ